MDVNSASDRPLDARAVMREALVRSALTSAQRAGSVPPRTCSDAQDQLGDGIALYLDGGETVAEAPSSIVDLTCEPPVLLREGAFSLDELREVCPGLVDSGNP